jgi:hypothetical protein
MNSIKTSIMNDNRNQDQNRSPKGNQSTDAARETQGDQARSTDNAQSERLNSSSEDLNSPLSGTRDSSTGIQLEGGDQGRGGSTGTGNTDRTEEETSTRTGYDRTGLESI